MKRTHAAFGLVLGLFGSCFFSEGIAEGQTQTQAPVYRTAAKPGSAQPGYFISDSTACAAESVVAGSCGCEAEVVTTSCGCESACESSCCGRTRGCGIGSRLGSNCESPLCQIGNLFPRNQCELGDQWSLFGNRCEDPLLNIGGWFQVGGYSDNNDLFWDGQDDRVNLHQGWLFVEKVAEAGECGEMGFGFRFDGMYGTDADDTVAFGNSQDGAGNPRGWDNGPNFARGGGYGWALPQLYLEAAKNDWSVKVGHFYTLVGYEVVTAPDNFFFSHAITMFNSEPFTHTGAVATYNASDDLTVYGGWTAGWDTGFDQFGNGSNFLGGFSRVLSDDATFTYITTFGDFGARGSEAYSHSMVLDTTLTENVNWVLQSDLLRVGSTGEDNVGLNSYLFYTCTDRLAFGSRSEWWKGDTLTGYAPHGGVLPASGSHSYYETTVGMNYRFNANLVMRPEYRYDRSPALNYDQGMFGIDFIALY